MNKKRLLKSIIGTVAIYGVLVAFLFILGKTVYLGLGELWVFPVSFVVCSIAAGILFKGQIYAWVWSAAAVIFVCAVCYGQLEFILTLGVPFVLMPLTIPFLIVKSIFISINEKKELAAQTGTEPQTENRE